MRSIYRVKLLCGIFEQENPEEIQPFIVKFVEKFLQQEVIFEIITKNFKKVPESLCLVEFLKFVGLLWDSNLKDFFTSCLNKVSCDDLSQISRY
jgi:hypothetical protein